MKVIIIRKKRHIQKSKSFSIIKGSKGMQDQGLSGYSSAPLTSCAPLRLGKCPLSWVWRFSRPHGLTLTWWGCYGLYFWHKPTELAHSFLFCSCVYFCLYGPFNCISFHKFSRQLSVFWPRSSGLISALPVLSTIYLFMKVSFSSNIIPSVWLGSKQQSTK